MSLPRDTWRTVAPILGAGTAAAAGLTAYAAWEARQYTLRRVTVQVLPPGHRSLRVLHLSDLHLTPGQTRKQEWLRGLGELRPDLVINTGDNLAHRDSVPVLRDSLGSLLDVPGGLRLRLQRLLLARRCATRCATCCPTTGSATPTPRSCRGEELRDTFTEAGWLDLTNVRDTLKVGDTTFAFAGRRRPAPRAGPAAPTSRGRPTRTPTCGSASRTRRTSGCSTSSPGDGYDAIIAGHTHGGQVCLPGGGALTTNCDLEPARAKGLHRHPADSRPGDPGSAWLHVSAGLGTSPYARIRVACRPEATLLTLAPRD